jgi:hypothetical protein
LPAAVPAKSRCPCLRRRARLVQNGGRLSNFTIFQFFEKLKEAGALA